MGSIQETRKLFTPLQVGDMKLSHRVIMSPLTRVRSPGGIPPPLVAEYYFQRASPGGLLISEGTLPSFMVIIPSYNLSLLTIQAGNLLDVPGIYTPEHIRAWKVVTSAVHAKGGYIFCQLWHVRSLLPSSNLTHITGGPFCHLLPTPRSPTPLLLGHQRQFQK